MSSNQYLEGDSLPKWKGKSRSTCAIPGAGILTCGLVPLQLMLSRLMVRMESLVPGCGPSLDTKSKRIEGALVRTKNLRHLFLNDTQLNRFPMRMSHSHATAASFRTSMNTYMKRLVVSAGFEPYLASMAAMDSNEGCDGTRLFYGMKDLSVPYRNDPVKDNHAIIMVDVDYYADMSKWLQFGQPILMYTFVPTQAAYSNKDDDFAYRLIDNKVEFKVSGGASYSHELWDYSCDKLSVTNKDGTLTTFLVEQRNVPGDPFHRFVVITPEARVAMPWHLYLEEVHQPIQRWKPLVEGINVLYNPIGDELSIGENGDWHSVQMSGALYKAIKTRVEAKSSAIQVADVERMMNAHKHPSAVVDAPFIYKVIGATLRANVINTNGAVNYLPVGSLATEDGQQSGGIGATPVVSQPARFPARAVGSDEATVRGRIDKVRNEKEPPVFIKHYANEFVQLVVPEKLAGTGAPKTVAEVVEHQNKPAQRARFNMIAATLSTADSNKLKSFVKVEPYASINDPRNITTMSPETTTLLSGYTLAMKEQVLKKHEWFGAGLTPAEQVERLRKLAQRNKNWLCTDYSRLDGSVSKFLQTCIVMAVYLRWAAQPHRGDLRSALLKVFVQKGFTSHGVPFKPGYGTRSGSPQTTDGNTLICAFVVYVAYRMMGRTPKEAWDSLGLYYGDDGASAADEGLAEALEKAAELLGLKLKCDMVERGKPVPYLGRFFVDPCTSEDSFQDPVRTLSKIHTTASRELTPAQAMVNKALGYLATDSKTPVIGAWARQILRITGLTEMAHATHEEEYKLSNAWPQNDPVAIREAMAEVTGWDVGVLIEMDEILGEVDALDRFPVLVETKLEVKIEAVVDGEVVTPPPAQHVTSDDERPPKPKPTATGRRALSMGKAGDRRHLHPSPQPRRKAGRVQPQRANSGDDTQTDCPNRQTGGGSDHNPSGESIDGRVNHADRSRRPLNAGNGASGSGGRAGTRTPGKPGSRPDQLPSKQASKPGLDSTGEDPGSRGGCSGCGGRQSPPQAGQAHRAKLGGRGNGRCTVKVGHFHALWRSY